VIKYSTDLTPCIVTWSCAFAVTPH